MIQELLIHNVATYTNPIEMRPKEINFCYGSNGSGKTTLACVIGRDTHSGNCRRSWQQSELPVLVYNKAFVDANFGEHIGGIFTLGEDLKDAQDFIDEKRKEVVACTNERESLSRNIERLKAGNGQAQTNFDDACWAIQQNHGEKFRDGLVGFRKSKQAFSKKCIDEFQANDHTEPPDIKLIEELYAAAYGQKADKYDLIEPISVPRNDNERCELLDQSITGSAETPVGKFIEYLQNSDWVRQGVNYAVRSKGNCPYCQQQLPEELQQSIADFFDESYERDCAIISSFQNSYTAFTNQILVKLKAIIVNSIPLLGYELFQAEVEMLSKIIEKNKAVIAEKTKAPTQKVSIESIEPIILKLNKHIDEFNEKINRNNAVVDDQANSQARCAKMIWQFFTYELREIIKQHIQHIDGFEKGTAGLSEKIHAEEKKQSDILKMIAEKEESRTSIIPTVNAINGILDRFGFTGFKLAENTEKPGTYKILRHDGNDAKKTLSEGEHNFIAFLYFFHSAYGSFERTGIATDKIIVIDDPISSLDSNVLFIITTLVKTMINDCLAKQNGIKQIFILTHNVYFHKEITFRGGRAQTYPPAQTAYWIIKKKDNISQIDLYEENPIKTSYELLWAELNEIENAQRVTIFNTLRRILEYYFNIIGGLDYEKCINEFEGQDKIICKALLASINDGSHFISDDFVMCYESDTLENYLRVFQLIFYKMGHLNHYNMMMKVPLESS